MPTSDDATLPNPGPHAGPPGDLPIHFFTIVLNGAPFIAYHEEVFQSLSVDWHWHIIEGVANHVHDSAWSLEKGGKIEVDLHRYGRSKDGTSDYLDGLKRRHKDRISLYRRSPGLFWDGKREMCNAPILFLTQECLLWQVDSDELWLKDQIEAVHRAFVDDPSRGAAYFWCHYFVGPTKIITTRNNYAQNPKQEWLRVWRFKPGDRWTSHAPPVLTRTSYDPDQALTNVATINPFKHDETEALGAVFQHFSFATPDQLRFKEKYYGYANALADWTKLQAHQGEGFLRDYFEWVRDETKFDDVEGRDVAPLARTDGTDWFFRRVPGKRPVP